MTRRKFLIAIVAFLFAVLAVAIFFNARYRSLSRRYVLPTTQFNFANALDEYAMNAESLNTDGFIRFCRKRGDVLDGVAYRSTTVKLKVNGDSLFLYDIGYDGIDGGLSKRTVLSEHDFLDYLSCEAGDILIYSRPTSFPRSRENDR